MPGTKKNPNGLDTSQMSMEEAWGVGLLSGPDVREATTAPTEAPTPNTDGGCGQGVLTDGPKPHK